MADSDHWISRICRFVTYYTKAGTSATTGQQSQPLETNGSVELEQFPWRNWWQDGGVEMSERCKAFLGCMNILATALVVGLAMEESPQTDTMATGNGRENEEEQTKATRDNERLQQAPAHRICTNGNNDADANSAIGVNCRDCRAVCTDCKALASRASRLLAECGYCGGEEHTVRATDCSVCGGVEHIHEANNGHLAEMPADWNATQRSQGACGSYRSSNLNRLGIWNHRESLDSRICHFDFVDTTLLTRLWKLLQASLLHVSVVECCVKQEKWNLPIPVLKEKSRMRQNQMIKLEASLRIWLAFGIR